MFILSQNDLAVIDETGAGFLAAGADDEWIVYLPQSSFIIFRGTEKECAAWIQYAAKLLNAVVWGFGDFVPAR